jgi:hypothetical protein
LGKSSAQDLNNIFYRNVLNFLRLTTAMERKPLRILFATEYLPPFVSGISNRCKNWINGYREEGHKVTVCSVQGSECDMVASSIANPFYNHQRFDILFLMQEPPFCHR